MQISILEWLEASAKRHPNRTAFFDINNKVAFSEVMAGAKSIGSRLSGLIEPGNPVAILTGRHAFTPICFLGVLYSGCYYVPLDPSSPAERLITILLKLNTKVILTDSENLPLAETLNFSGTIILMEKARQTKINEVRLGCIRTQMTDLDPLYVIFTSGSTGMPKGVVTSHRAMFSFISGLVDVTGIDHTDVIGSQAPLDYVGAVKDLYAGLFTGASVFIIPKACFTVSENLFDLLNEHRITSIAWTVTALVLPT
ncbi:MAG: AMP-binding protein, partial [Bacillota bacterium]